MSVEVFIVGTCTCNSSWLIIFKQHVDEIRGTVKMCGQVQGEGKGRCLTKFITGRLCPEVQPLTLLYAILAEKVPVYIPFIEKRYPFHIPTLEHCNAFLSPCNRVIKYYQNKCSAHDKCNLFRSRCEATDFPTVLYTSNCEIPTLSHT